MPIYKGSSKTGKIYRGSTKIGKIYKGSTLVYSSAPKFLVQGSDYTTYAGCSYVYTIGEPKVGDYCFHCYLLPYGTTLSKISGVIGVSGSSITISTGNTSSGNPLAFNWEGFIFYRYKFNFNDLIPWCVLVSPKQKVGDIVILGVGSADTSNIPYKITSISNNKLSAQLSNAGSPITADITNTPVNYTYRV